MHESNVIHVDVPDDLYIPLPLVIRETKFPLGRIVMTANAGQQLAATAVVEGLKRHAAGDWGDLMPEDILSNHHALTQGGRLLSAYDNGEKRFWIITEADRSVTTVLMPDDY